MLTVRIQPTDKGAVINGTPCRLWTGLLDSGHVVDVWVALVGSASSEALEAVSAGMRAAGPLQPAGGLAPIAAAAERAEQRRV